MGSKNSASNRGASASHQGDTSKDDGAGDETTPLTPESIREIVQDTIRETQEEFGRSLQTSISRAVKDHVGREFKRRSDDAPDTDTSDSDDSADSGSNDSGEGKPSVADRKRDSAMKQLQSELDELKAERKKAIAEGKKRGREAELRKTLKAVGVRDEEAAFRYIREELQVDEENNTFFGEGSDGNLLSLQKVVENVVAREAWLQPLTGNEGEGGPGQGKAIGGSKGPEYDTKSSPTENLTRYFEKADS